MQPSLGDKTEGYFYAAKPLRCVYNVGVDGHLLAAKVICATVPIEVGPPRRNTFLAAWNT